MVPAASIPGRQMPVLSPKPSRDAMALRLAAPATRAACQNHGLHERLMARTTSIDPSSLWLWFHIQVLPNVMPLGQLNSVSGLTLPLSRAARAVTTLKVDAGGYSP